MKQSKINEELKKLKLGLEHPIEITVALADMLDQFAWEAREACVEFDEIDKWQPVAESLEHETMMDAMHTGHLSATADAVRLLAEMGVATIYLDEYKRSDVVGGRGIYFGIDNDLVEAMRETARNYRIIMNATASK